jgi:hypothetical protein
MRKSAVALHLCQTHLTRPLEGHAAAEGCEHQTGLVQGMDAVSSTRWTRRARRYGGWRAARAPAEERDVLARGTGRVQATGAHVERAGEVEVLVVTRRDDQASLSGVKAP